MPTYIYETIPQAGEEPRHFEVWQSMKDAPLSVDPETGCPVRRVITGGFEMPRASAMPKAAPKAGHSDSCACCNPVRKK
jgi:hypothetical protein